MLVDGLAVAPALTRQHNRLCLLAVVRRFVAALVALVEIHVSVGPAKIAIVRADPSDNRESEPLRPITALVRSNVTLPAMALVPLA
jgi:hypothetical protein